MTHRKTLFAALLATVLTTAALANPTHHPQGAATPPGAAPMGIGGGMMAHMQGASRGQIEGMMNHAASGMPCLAGLSGAEFEQAFMSMMIAHHQGAIAMADWVLERGDDPEVLAAARAVKAAQAPEIEQMTTWLRVWYDADIDTASAAMMDSEMSGMLTGMAEGSDPDAAFLSQMSAHHQGAIDMAQLALVRATHAELRDLARDVIVTQAGEVHQYQTWLDDSAD